MENTRSKDWYISNFKTIEESLNGESRSPFHELRKNAILKFEEIDFPTRKNEDWKYTDVSPVLKHNYTPSPEVKITKNDVSRFLMPGLKVNLLVLVNGRYSGALSKIHKQDEGVIIDSFRSTLKADPALVLKYFGKYAEINNGFAALNTAYAADGAFIYIPDNKQITDHIHIMNITSGESINVLSQPRNLYIAGKNSHVRIIESYHSLNDQENLTNVVTEAVLDENSFMEVYRLQKENPGSYHINFIQAEQKSGSTFTHYSVSLDGKLVRNDTNIKLDGEFCTSHLYGLYITENDQHVDNHTLIDHAKPNCQSNEIYKGVLNDNSRGVFNGKVFVREDAQKTNAYQSNKAILLSSNATIDTKPQLEIYADDVKCSHGAAIGQLDDEAVFYLRSRGIGKEMAKTVLIRAFANDIFDTIENEALHDDLNNMVLEKLK
jgi:Fe-S cluster assembly protein SufD